MKITRAEVLKQDHFRPVYLIDLDCADRAYVTAQDVAIFPQNSQQTIERLARLQNYDLNVTFSFSAQKHDVVPFPTPCTLEHALRVHCDLTGPVRKDLLTSLLPYAKDPEDQKHIGELLQLSREAYDKRVTSAKWTVVDVLQRYQSVQCPFPEFIQIVDRILPRYFTAASSSAKDPRTLQLCIAILKETTSQMKQWTGLCTGFLESQCIQCTFPPMRVFLADSQFRLPASASFIMVANGCGVAPFRAFINELQHTSHKDRDVYLFFGCQSIHNGFFFREEFEAALGEQADESLQFEHRGTGNGQKRVLTRLFCAFSRDQPQKIYIQQVVSHHSAIVNNVVFRQGGYMFLCGSEGMVSDVQKLLERLAEARSPGRGAAVIAALKQEKRLVQESWG